MKNVIQSGFVIALILLVSGCSPADHSAGSPGSSPTLTPGPTEIPRPTPTSTPTPYIGGECDPETERVYMNTSVIKHVSGGTYPDTCEIFCLWVPDGRQLEIGISDFEIDLDLYVDIDLSILEYGDHGLWMSNGYGSGDELVVIEDPGGRYYVQVCSYEAAPSDFRLRSTFTP